MIVGWLTIEFRMQNYLIILSIVLLTASCANLRTGEDRDLPPPGFFKDSSAKTPAISLG